ncbi:MAG: hydroxymethylbilane synthase [Candidatus Eremiobacterota bacterium]
MQREIIIGTRGSRLALIQSEYIMTKFQERGYSSVLKIIKTKGDKILDTPLSKIGDKGLFVKEIEEELLRKTIDIAVHSLKDLPSVLPDELCIGAIPEREDKRDVFISNDGRKLHDLPSGKIIGTSSLRRKAQILSLRPDFIVKDIRGNLDTRLRKLEELEFDGLILAAAGLIRMNLKNRITEYLSTDMVIPSAGQGAIAVEVRKDNKQVMELLKEIDDPVSRDEITAERSFLFTIEGGCQIPAGASASISGNGLILKGFIASTDGKKFFRGEVRGDRNRGKELGKELAEKLLSGGAYMILRELRG